MPRKKELEHGMLLDAKNVMDDALPELEQIRELIPERLHDEFDKIVRSFEEILCTADVSSDYIERGEYDDLDKELTAIRNAGRV